MSKSLKYHRRLLKLSFLPRDAATVSDGTDANLEVAAVTLDDAALSRFDGDSV